MSLVSYFGIIAVAEIFFLFILFHPKLIPAKFLTSFQYYYNNYQREILQYDTAIAGYDASVFYKMKPDRKFLFQNIEFSDSITTNSGGFRDDENSLRNYKIICAGDSYTLGWGVHQDESYPNQLERLINLPVLNTGMSSYGTAREIETIRRLDTSKIQWVVLQYCYNDFDENLAFVQNHDSLVISSRQVYDTACDEVYWSNIYFPGKCFFSVSKIFFKGVLDDIKAKFSKNNKLSLPAINNADTSARYFLEVLSASGLDFKKLHLIIFDICEYEYLNDNFINALEKRLQLQENLQAFNNNIHLLRIANLLNPSDFYILDGHVRPSGQKKVALQVAHLIESLK
jgi:hypothetical protein